MRLQACIQRLSNENVSLLKERESIKAIYEYAQVSQAEMVDFRAQYRAKYAELRSALEDFRQQNPPRQPLQGVSSYLSDIVSTCAVILGET